MCLTCLLKSEEATRAADHMIVRENLLRTAGAHFSDDWRYRYLLWRRWGGDHQTCRWLNLLMLNPSKATEEVNDPTVTRQMTRAQMLGYDGLYVTNIFALRSTDPSLLYKAEDPIGSENDKYIRQTAVASAMVICAWGGTHGGLNGRSMRVRELLRGIPLHALKIGKTGDPAHPLYQKYDLQPKPWGAA